MTYKEDSSFALLKASPKRSVTLHLDSTKVFNLELNPSVSLDYAKEGIKSHE